MEKSAVQVRMFLGSHVSQGSSRPRVGLQMNHVTHDAYICT